MAPDIKSPEPYSTLNACIHDYLRLWMPESCFKRSFFSKRNPFIWSTQHRDSHFKCQPPMPVTVVLVLVLGIFSKLKKKKRCLYLISKQNSKPIVLHELCELFPSRIIWRSKIYGIHHFFECVHSWLSDTLNVEIMHQTKLFLETKPMQSTQHREWHLMSTRMLGWLFWCWGYLVTKKTKKRNHF